MPASAPVPAILVSHSHWDRAWYLPFETFRFRLVRMVDRLLDLLENDPAYRAFTLDGQTVLLEDYLEIRPEQEAHLLRLIRAGRLLVGPFYVLPDLFLVSGESLIRNLQRGLQMSSDAGNATAPVGYLPDPFGHPAQMPQILEGFGIDTYLLTRGLSAADLTAHGSLFRWCAPDGSEVTAFYGRDGYFNASALGHADDYGRFDGQPLDTAAALSQLDATRARLLPLQKSATLLLLNGFDHMPEQAGLPPLLAEIAEKRPDWRITHGTLADFFDSVRDEAPTLEQGEGDLIGNADHPILLSVYSTRLYLKRQNHHAQHVLTQIAEPLRAILHIEKQGPDPRPFLGHAWRELLRNHPHDDICGCSVDEVHRDDEARFRHVDEIGRALITEALEVLVQDGFAPSASPPGTDVFVFNPHPQPETFTVECDVLFPNREGEFGPVREESELGAVDGEGRPVAVAVCATEAPELRSAFLEATWGRRYRVRFSVDVPPLGYQLVRVFERAAGAAPQSHNTQALENAHWRLEVDRSTLTMLNKQTGERRSDVLRFHFERDAGDTYSFGPVMGDAPRYAHLVNTQPDAHDPEKLCCLFALDVPQHLGTEETTRLGIQASLRLDGARGLAVEISYENTARDGRLRVLFPAGLHTGASLADALFRLAQRERPALLTPENAAERYNAFPGELTYTTHHSGDFVLVGDDARRTWVANRGLPEYELVDGPAQTEIAVTLCRSVGWLSVKGGRIRRVAAGPKVPTPEAQCLRKMGGSLLFGFGEVSAVEAARACRVFAHPAWVQELPALPFPAGSRPRTGSFLHISNPAVVLSAFRPESGGPGVVVRVFNPTDQPQQAVLTMGFPAGHACETDLHERWDKAAAMPCSDTLHFTLAPYRIATYVLRP